MPTEPNLGGNATLRQSDVRVRGPIDLGTYGGIYSEPRGINARGQVVGYNVVEHETPHKALLWYRGTVTDLGDFAGPPEPWAVNDPGQVVGWAGSNGFLWQRGTVTSLGSFLPRDINNSGDIVGAIPFGGDIHAALWRHGQVTDLSSLRGANGWSNAIAVNDRGQILGESPAPGRPDYEYHAVLWEAGLMKDLGAWRPIDINGQGQIVGVKWVDAFTEHVVVWHRGTLTDLGLDDFYPRAIGDQGEIVGTLADAAGRGFAVLWKQGTYTHLGTLGGDHSGAIAVNPRGQIIGISTTLAGESHAVLWEVH
jgi:probable HAF family extracellular repeat protein